MKPQRIRYEKKGTQLVSKHEVVSARGTKYLVYLNLDTMTYLIRNSTSLRKYEGGEGINNLIVLKRKVKQHLAHLGVYFDKERRNRTFGICSKGHNEFKELEKRKKEKNRGLEELSKLSQEMENKE